MKKTELETLTKIIEVVVAREVRKQLPAIIGETFKNMMGKSVVTEQFAHPIREEVEIHSELNRERNNSKVSLKELFSETSAMKSSEQSQRENSKPIRQFTKDPILNQILNETNSDLKQRERLVGAAAFQGGYSPALAMIPEFNSAMSAGSMMASDEEPSFSRNMPIMPGSIPGIPIHSTRPTITNDKECGVAPLSISPEVTSVLDITNQIPNAAISKALTRNYSQMMKLIDNKKKLI